MAYDGFIVISKPLCSPFIMNRKVCIYNVGICASAFLMAVIPVLVTPIQFHGHNAVNCITCELQVIFELTCSQVLVKEILTFTSGVLVLSLLLGFIVLSYFRSVVWGSSSRAELILLCSEEQGC